MRFCLSEFLINKTKLNDADTKDPLVRARYGYLEGWISLGFNLLIFIIKVVMAFITQSISIIADAVHTMSDVATSAVVIWGFKEAKKPADKEHPFGHGRMENIATLIIAVLVCVIGMEILRSSFLRILTPKAVKGSFFVIVMLFASLIIKEWLARFSFFLAKRIDSSTLYADSFHHRSDAVSTFLVILAIAGSMYNMFILDGLFGCIVAVYIIYTGIKLIKSTTVNLLGKAADRKVKNEIKNIAKSVDGVQGVHDIVVHEYGDFKAISLHVEVEPKLDSLNAHKIATSVETQIARQIKSSPIVHIDLKKQGRKKSSKNYKQIKKIVSNFHKIINFHGMEILSNESGDFLNLHIIVSKVMQIEDAHKLEHDVKTALTKEFEDHNVSIHIEPCDSNCKRCLQECKQN